METEPRAIADMVGGSTTWTRFAELTARTDPPHIILAGAAGVGKSCALRIALAGRITLWMRCSADPSLRDNRDRIKNIARQRTEGVSWIVLEHADALHADSQAFLRRVIETSVGSTRFVLEVRDVAAVAEPLLSRTVLFNVPTPLEYEIRAEVMRRAPATPLAVAERIAAQSGGNLRWAVLQGLGGSDGFVAESVLDAGKTPPASWADVLAQMEAIQNTGSSAKAWLGASSAVWERPGAVCPWALTAHALAARLPVPK
jgi:hypothetical protein